jgi:dipeptidyl aminopeptidase/acylaminoacyl peptidase
VRAEDDVASVDEVGGDLGADAGTADNDSVESPDEEAGEDEDESDQPEPGPADVQVWHSGDDQIVRAQEYRATQISRQTNTSAWHLDEDHFVVLGDDLDEPVRIIAGGSWGLVPDYDPYAFERRFGAGTTDWYRVDVTSGERVMLAEGAEFGVQSHPDLDRVLVYGDDRWTAIALEDLTHVPIGDGRSFTRSLQDYDYPGPRPSWGLGAWSDDGTWALVYDKHDVWRADVEDGSLRQLTTGAVDGGHDQYRVTNVDRDQPRFGPVLLDSNDDIWLSVRDMRTKESGYARASLDGSLDVRVFEGARTSGLVRAADADRFAFRMERWDDAPDVFVGNEELDDLVQVTETNPFQDDYAWGHAELLDYTTDAGHDLQAILVYPADFQEGREYPLILYQYERLSDNLHVYDVPSERDYYNYQAWSQEGYFVLMPDIVYEPGRPGPSALDAVEHALDAAVATGHVDPDRMGLIGHSWGGYQAAYLPTRTNRFAASVAGAAITNFMSFMGAVHWNGGLPEVGHWETGQARMAVPYWEDVEGHLESSPANFIMDLETPMLLMHGDADGVVDFRQGLEFYNYARRAGKEMVLLVYPGADHGLREETQQVDYHRRILEWFGHYLKGEPPATWITDGESWTERAKRLGN